MLFDGIRIISLNYNLFLIHKSQFKKEKSSAWAEQSPRRYGAKRIHETAKVLGLIQQESDPLTDLPASCATLQTRRTVQAVQSCRIKNE